MLNTLVQSTTKFMEAHQELPSSSTAETLVAVVYVRSISIILEETYTKFYCFQICRNMLERSDYVQRLSEINRMFFLRVMVGSLVLFDHIDQDGAFSRHSPVDIKTVIDVIKQNGGDEVSSISN